ncbi:acyltransferase [Streptomyces sp. MTZ3.1]|uniref:Acyltransferase n=1 Tax=Streptomyces meridianus TaxID=2938945 RepID=A0ABT0WZX0_9ACTN|nr:acyltransferase [Streptomyces meridianus]MCM2575813.1 acyltransferase [Streptomyces meridianus]
MTDAQAGGRDRCLDLLRALALVRVVAYHAFGWAWLTLVFPSMGVMFALAGSLMARSLRRPAVGVILRRFRRLLLPLWLYGVVVLGILFSRGWHPDRDAPFWWWLRVACWVVPVGSPLFPEHFGGAGGLLETTWAEQAAGPLWYLRAYLWFVLLSPMLLRMFRRAPRAVLCAPLALTALLGTGLVEIPGETGEAVTDFAVHGSCWILGFCHADGLLRRLPRYLVPSVAPVLMGLALWWASGHRGEDGWDLNDIPPAQGLWSFGFCALLLHFSPSWRELPGPLRRFDKPVTLAGNRAMTIYLWHEAALLATVPLLDQLWDVPGASPAYAHLLESSSSVLMFLLTWPLLALIVPAVGWVEDVAAGRRPRLWPNGRGGGHPRPGWHRVPGPQGRGTERVSGPARG